MSNSINDATAAVASTISNTVSDVIKAPNNSVSTTTIVIAVIVLCLCSSSAAVLLAYAFGTWPFSNNEASSYPPGTVTEWTKDGLPVKATLPWASSVAVPGVSLAFDTTGLSWAVPDTRDGRQFGLYVNANGMAKLYHLAEPGKTGRSSPADAEWLNRKYVDSVSIVQVRPSTAHVYTANVPG